MVCLIPDQLWCKIHNQKNLATWWLGIALYLIALIGVGIPERGKYWGYLLWGTESKMGRRSSWESFSISKGKQDVQWPINIALRIQALLSLAVFTSPFLPFLMFIIREQNWALFKTEGIIGLLFFLYPSHLKAQTLGQSFPGSSSHSHKLEGGWGM